MAMIGNNKTGKPFWEYLFGSNEPATTTTTTTATKPTLVDKVKDLWDTARTPTINADGSEGLTPMQAFSQAILTTPSNSAGLILGKGMGNVYELNQASAKNQKALEDKRTKDANRLALGKALSMAKTPEEVQAAISQYPDATPEQIVGAASGTIDYYAKQKENADKYTDNDKERANRVLLQQLQEAGANSRLTEQGRQKLAELQAEASINKGNADYYAEQGYDSSGKPIELPAGSVDINGNPTGSGKATATVGAYYNNETGTVESVNNGVAAANPSKYTPAAYSAEAQQTKASGKVVEAEGKATAKAAREQNADTTMSMDKFTQLSNASSVIGDSSPVDYVSGAIGSVAGDMGSERQQAQQVWDSVSKPMWTSLVQGSMAGVSNTESGSFMKSIPAYTAPKAQRDRWVNGAKIMAIGDLAAKSKMAELAQKGILAGSPEYEKEIGSIRSRVIEDLGKLNK